MNSKEKLNEIKKEPKRLNKENNKIKKHKVLKIIGIIVTVILLILMILSITIYCYMNSKLNKINIEYITNDLNELGISEANANQDSQMSKFRNIAILGLDSMYDTYDPDYRTDCIMVASINKETNEVKIFSIYRDTYVQMELDGETIFDKINHAYYNGVENTLKTINENLDLNITDVSKVVGRTSSNITKTGVQHLDGIQAVAFCRIRYTSGLDYKRTERMREVLGKVVDKIKVSDLGTINNLLDTILPKIRTNITQGEIKKLIPMALSLKLTDSFGWPYTTTGVWMRGDFYGPATTLESNVKKLHEEVYGQTDYVVPENIVEISNKIVEETGVK